MTVATGNIVRTICGGCSIAVAVDVSTGDAIARIPSNKRQGKFHRPAHEARTEGWVDDTLAYWECPSCEYPDSTYVDPDVRADLS